MLRQKSGLLGWFGGFIAAMPLCCLSCIPAIEPSYPAIVVLVTDAVTGWGIMGATVVVSEGDQIEVLHGGEPSDIRWGVYRAGTFDLQVTAEGYEPAVVADVWVPAERYMRQDYVPVNVVVRLVPVATAGESVNP